MQLRRTPQATMQRFEGGSDWQLHLWRLGWGRFRRTPALLSRAASPASCPQRVRPLAAGVHWRGSPPAAFQARFKLRPRRWAAAWVAPPQAPGF